MNIQLSDFVESYDRVRSRKLCLQEIRAHKVPISAYYTPYPEDNAVWLTLLSRKRRLLLIEKAMGIFLIIITLPVILIVSCDKSSSDEPTFAIEVEGEGNAVSADAKEDQAIFEVFSERGIGAASIVMVTGEFPASGILVFHLQGLEELRFSYQETEVLVSMSSSQGNGIRESVILGSGSARQEIPIMPESPYWMGVEILEADGSTGSIPLTDGVIKVSLPEDFLLESQDSFRIQWIDFYR